MRVSNFPNPDTVIQAEEVFKTAEAKLRQVLSIKPGEVDVLVKLGLVLTARAELRSQTHEADTLYCASMECFRKAHALAPGEAAPFANWGLALHSKARTRVGDEAHQLY